jgi:hypothetical protein
MCGQYALPFFLVFGWSTFVRDSESRTRTAGPKLQPDRCESCRKCRSRTAAWAHHRSLARCRWTLMRWQCKFGAFHAEGRCATSGTGFNNSKARSTVVYCVIVTPLQAKVCLPHTAGNPLRGSSKNQRVQQGVLVYQCAITSTWANLPLQLVFFSRNELRTTTLTPMNTRTQSHKPYPCEHLRRNEHPADLEIPEVITDGSLSTGTSFTT